MDCANTTAKASAFCQHRLLYLNANILHSLNPAAIILSYTCTLKPVIMKKVVPVCFVFLFFSAVAAAQGGFRHYRTRAAEITRFERLQLQKDVLRYRIAVRNAERDGIVTPLEKRNVQKMKQKTRRDAFRFRHNGRNRVI
jgi:hypothetical protein